MLNNRQSPVKIAKSTNIPERDITRIAEANGIETKLSLIDEIIHARVIG